MAGGPRRITGVSVPGMDLAWLAPANLQFLGECIPKDGLLALVAQCLGLDLFRLFD